MEKLNDQITLYNADCMEVMKTFKDKQFDLAIVDPPYGILKAFTSTSRIAKYGQTESVNDWKPTKDYFQELFRVSKNQIIWGYNHLSDMLPSCKEFLFWYKHQPVISYADGELAWTSFKKTAHCIDLPYFGTINADTIRIHPTQKPVKLYDWILGHYAKPGMKILDTFGGSMSSVIACYRGGYEVTCIELDSTYYEKAKRRVENEIAQPFLFDVKETRQEAEETFLFED